MPCGAEEPGQRVGKRVLRGARADAREPRVKGASGTGGELFRGTSRRAARPRRTRALRAAVRHPVRRPRQHCRLCLLQLSFLSSPRSHFHYHLCVGICCSIINNALSSILNIAHNPWFQEYL